MQNKEIWEKRHRASQGKYFSVTEFAKLVYEKILQGKTGQFLDLGCGKGTDSIFFHENGMQVSALDYANEAIQQFNEMQKKKGLFIKTLVFDYREILPFENESFDYAFSRLGLNYFDAATTKNIFREIDRVLKTGGLVLFQVKSSKDKSYGIGNKLEEDYFEARGYKRRYFKRAYIEELLKGYAFLHLEEKVILNGHAYFDVVAKKP